MGREIKYTFEFQGSKKLEYTLNFDEQNQLMGKDNGKIKDWTRLDFNQCKNCPLSVDDYIQCPVAKNIDEIVEETKDKVSYEKAYVTVETPERVYAKNCDTQEGLLSLFGLIMPTSGCPHLDWFRPLARFHLPFSTLEETMFRVLALRLVGHFLDSDDLDKVDLDYVKKQYSAVEVVNLDFIGRMHTYCKGDADVNAVAALDLFAKLFQFEQESDFKSLRSIFAD